jgi:hypothetical protein
LNNRPIFTRIKENANIILREVSCTISMLRSSIETKLVAPYRNENPNNEIIDEDAPIKKYFIPDSMEYLFRLLIDVKM